MTIGDTTMIENQKTFHRLAKLMSRAGIASRRDSEKIILSGRVEVNGVLVDNPARNVSTDDNISVDGHLLTKLKNIRIWLYNKPVGLVSTTSDEKNRATIYDSIPDSMPRVMSIGRLDINSEGLLLLTNSGDLKRHMELPANNWSRQYKVRVYGRKLEDRMFEPLLKGIVVDGIQFRPIKVNIERSLNSNSWLTVSLQEGKNREIRKAFEAIGLTVNRLIRVSHGPFDLGDLSKGALKEVPLPNMLQEFINSIDL